MIIRFYNGVEVETDDIVIIKLRPEETTCGKLVIENEPVIFPRGVCRRALDWIAKLLS